LRSHLHVEFSLSREMKQPETVSTLEEATASPELLNELWEELFLKTGKLWGRTSSGSMRPLIPANSRVLVERIGPDQIRFGDIALFRSGKRLVIHRVLGKRREQGELTFLQKGDYNAEAGFIPAAAILGRVWAVERNDAEVYLLSGRWRAIQIALACYSLATLGVRQAGRLILTKLSLRGRGLGAGFDRLVSAGARFLERIMRLR
jgi:signal peptidase I